MITISGTASSRGIGSTTPVPGLTVAAYKSSDMSTVIVMTTTDANGNYSLVVPTNGAPLDGYLKATGSGYVDTYLYPPAPLTADFSDASVNMLTSSTYSLVFTLSQVTQTPGTGLIALEVMDSTMTTVAGATVSTNPAGTYRYNGSSGTPDKTSTSTQSDGIAYVLNVPAGSVTVSAAMSGATFKSHAVASVAGAFTTTIISE